MDQPALSFGLRKQLGIEPREFFQPVPRKHFVVSWWNSRDRKTSVLIGCSSLIKLGSLASAVGNEYYSDNGRRLRRRVDDYSIQAAAAVGKNDIERAGHSAGKS